MVSKTGISKKKRGLQHLPAQQREHFQGEDEGTHGSNLAEHMLAHAIRKLHNPPSLWVCAGTACERGSEAWLLPSGAGDLWAQDPCYLGAQSQPFCSTSCPHDHDQRSPGEDQQEVFSFDFWADVTPAPRPRPTTGPCPQALRSPTCSSFCSDPWVPRLPLHGCSSSSSPASSWYH